MRVLLKNFHIWFGILCVFCFAISCNAPRNNPVDPENPDYGIVMIEGVVKSHTDGTPISNIRVTWNNQNLITYTDSVGHFKFDNIKNESGWLYFSGDEYFTDSTYVEWDVRKKYIVEKYLNSIIVLNGFVYSNPPSVPIAGFKVTWQNQLLSTYTNKSGYFEFKNLECNNGWLYFSGDEYSTDSVYINWGQRKEVSVSVYLNSYPKLESVSFYSSIEYSFYETPVFSLTLNARVTDHDNDIDSVFIENDELKFSQPLDYNVATRYFEDKIYLLDLGLEDNSEVIGKNFKITVQDTNGVKYVIGETYIKRVILNYVQFISPSGQDTTGSRPELKWVRFTPGFSFNYIIQVYRSEQTSSILGWQVTCPSSEISATVNIDLPKGRYTWIIWCVDEFGNRSSSKEASFIVGGG